MIIFKTPFPVGFYAGNPSLDATQEAQFEANYTDFGNLMGATPLFIDSYVDETKAISSWVSNETAQAIANAKSLDASKMTPIIALPMTSTADPSISADQYYKNFASGQYDTTIQGMVKAWASQGFTTQYWRPGWEMNIPTMPSYAGSDATTQADWISAFQHIYTVLHQEAIKEGITVQVIWNPSTINSSPAGTATQTLYPGNQYVDIIGADVYADIHPYNLYDWAKNDGTVDSTLQQWLSNPVNLEHYYTYPASTQFTLDASGGKSLSLQNIIDFATAQGKPIAVVETGAGANVDGAGVVDNPTFVQWLSTTLNNSTAPVSFVNLWDANAGGNYKFTGSMANKPLEAAAWSKYFGVPVAPVIPDINIGSGNDKVTITLSEDAYAGDAQVSVMVDGVTYGGVETITALHNKGESQTINISGNWGAGQHNVAVSFLNDAWGGSYLFDRNAYVGSVAYNGSAILAGTASLYSNATASFTVGTPLPATTYMGLGKDILDFKMSEDAYKGDAQFSISVDGVQVGSTQAVVAIHAVRQEQEFVVSGSWGAGPHTVTVNFLNDASDPNGNYAFGTDRNLYVDKLSYDGVQMLTATVPLYGGGPQNIAVSLPSDVTTTIGSGTDTLVLNMAEDKYLVDAQFSVTVDGVQIGGIQTATASQQYGHTQTFNVLGNWGTGQHTVGVNFLNDASDPNGHYAVGTDRNLYLMSATYDGVGQTGGSLALLGGGLQSFTAGVTDKLVLTVAEDAYLGDAQFTVSVDGKQAGGIYTATALKSANQTRDFTIGGNWGLGSHTVSVNFLNDASGPGGYPNDRNLYVLGAKLDGTTQTNATLTEYSNGPQSFTATTATTYNPGSAGGTITTLGNDTVNVGSGSVVINANGLSSKVIGGLGAMTFIGSNGKDLVIGGSGASSVTGGSGTLDFTQGGANSTVTAMTGKEIINMLSGQSAGTLTLNNFVPGFDIIHLSGYSGTGISSETVVNGSTQVVLTDNTHINLIGVSDPYTKSVFG